MIRISATTDTSTRIQELVKNLSYLYSLDASSKIEIHSFGDTTPLAITPLASVINQKKLFYDKEKNTDYLQTISFPEGEHVLQLKKKRSHFPIIHISLAGMTSVERASAVESLTTAYLHFLSSHIVADKQFLKLLTNNTFGFILGEMLTNIHEHARAENAYILAQYSAEEDTCEICIVDDGQGIYASLKNAGRHVQNSHDALYQAASQGLSAKDEFGSMYRGTGLKQTRACVTSPEMKGEFFLMSGDAAFLHTAQQGEIFYRLSHYYWQGTIVMIKIRKPSKGFNIYDYVN